MKDHVNGESGGFTGSVGAGASRGIVALTASVP